jgi:transcriptional regulator GlxA family with amidase domain
MDPRVRTVIRLLQTRPNCRFTIAELARTVNLSHWRLTHLFAQELQISPSEFSRQLRLEKAKNLLESSFLSIKEIMGSVGISDKSHFAKDFKRTYGLSPAEYRRKHSASQCNE